MRPNSKLEAIRAVNGGPKTTQHANAVIKSIRDNIKSLYLLDKLLKIIIKAFIN